MSKEDCDPFLRGVQMKWTMVSVRVCSSHSNMRTQGEVDYNSTPRSGI